MTNRVDIEVTGTNKFDATNAAVIKTLKATDAQVVKTTASAKKLSEAIEAKPKLDGVKDAERALRKLGDSADDAFDKVKSKMEEAFKDVNTRAKIKVRAEIDKEALKSSVADGLGGLDFFGDKDIVKGGLFGKALQGIAKGIDLGEAGAKGAVSFVSGLGDGLKNQHPAVQAAVYGTLATAVLTVAPLVGAALGGGLIAGFGAVIGGLGVLAAAQNDEVQSSYRDLWDGIVEDVKRRAVVYEQVLVRTAQRAQTLWNESGNAVERAFDKVAPGVERMLDGVLRTIQTVVSHFDPIADAANAVFEDLGARLPGIIDEIMESFDFLAEAVAKNPEALGDFVASVGEVIEIGVNFVSALTYMYGSVRDFFDFLSKGAPWNVLDEGGEVAGKVGTKMTELSKIGGETDGKLKGIQQTFRDLAEAEDDAAKRGDAFLDFLNKVNGIVPSFDDALKDSNDTIRGLIDNFKNGAKEGDGFGKTLLNADGTINTMTKNGSLLYDAMSDLRENFADMAGATKELEAAGMSHEAAVQKVNEAVATQGQRLLEAADKMGLNQDQMRELLRLYGLTPKQIETLLNLDDKNFRDRLAYDLLPQTKTIHVIYNNLNAPLTQGSGRQYGVTDYAQGGNVAKAAAGGVRSNEVVINDGPGYPGEAVRLPNGSTVWPAGMTQMMMKRAATGAGLGGGGGSVELEWIGPPDLIEYLKANIRVRGGDPSVLG